MTDNAPPRYQRNEKCKNKVMIISSINVKGLCKSVDEFKLLVDEEDIPVLAINESKLDNETSNEIISLDNVELRRKDCNRPGMG